MLIGRWKCPGGGAAHALKRTPPDPDPEVITVDAAATAVLHICKEICSIVASPSFEGWLAPVTFSPDRFAHFSVETCGSVAIWIAAVIAAGAASIPCVEQGKPGGDSAWWKPAGPSTAAA